MNLARARFLPLLLLSTLTLAAPPATHDARWTEKEDSNGELTHILQHLHTELGFTVGAADLILFEDRELATSHFQQWTQAAAGVPVHGNGLRIWTDRKSGATIQVEARLTDPAELKPLEHQFRAMTPARLASPALKSLVRTAIASHEDARVQGWKSWKLEWRDGALVWVANVRARRGVHTVLVSPERGRVVGHRYTPFAQGEFSLPARVYPIYEEVEGQPGTTLERVDASLKYLNTRVPVANDDVFGELRKKSYLEDTFDTVLGSTPSGQQQGFWSMLTVKADAAAIRGALPTRKNNFSSGGVLLDGRYATVSIHPNAIATLSGINFTSGWSAQLLPIWQPTTFNGQDTYEMVPTGSRLGRPLLSKQDAYTRLAHRLANHDPATYLNDGFDEVQVYYSINTLMESLHASGFNDPELSTRPFHAFLYDLDIGMRDNAYYTDDTINFTTYSPEAPNYARDNSTIWHELGHGVMDRLMGDLITLADTGGLSEGMADFVAQMVIEDKLWGQTFPGHDTLRILNQIGFNLTNEVHDDGEAYGGSMFDLMQAAIKAKGKAGLHKVVDLTMETMRLTRNHPGLTAEGWFSHMLFADSRGHAGVRAPGEMAAWIKAALAGRNFTMTGEKLAAFHVQNGGVEVEGDAPGTRGEPIKTPLADGQTASFTLAASLVDGDAYKFQYPVTLAVGFNGGPLQGAVHWTGEEKGPQLITLHSPSEVATVPLTAEAACDFSNREDGSCVDYVYARVFNAGVDAATGKPVAKKRFYVRVLKP